MSYLTTEQRESLERALKLRLGVLRREITVALRQKDTPETMHLANRFEETGDDVLADIELSLDIATVERDLAELRSVLKALGRINSPGYGACSDCEADIPLARLRAEPAALRCVECQERYEHSHAGSAHSSL
jgi:DnaK suppressor protein